MMNLDDAVAQYVALNPAAYSELELFELRQPMSVGGRSPETSLRIILRSGHFTGNSRLALTFHGIAELHLEAGAYSQLIQLEIISIRDRGWQQLNYLVHETENDVLRFYCQMFSAEVIE